MIKQIIGFIFLMAFIGYMGHKFYKAVEDTQYASLIIYLSVIILIIILIGVGKQLKGY